MKNILITGANGQLGNEMRVVSAEQEQLVYHFTDVAELDICDIEAIERYVVDHAIDCIVNCAAYTNVNKAEEDTELCDKLNHQDIKEWLYPLHIILEDSKTFFLT